MENILYEIEKLNLENIDFKNALRKKAGFGYDKSKCKIFFSPRKLYSDYKQKLIDKNLNNIVLPNFPHEEWLLHLFYGPKNKKIVIYTCVTGNYDSISSPLFFSENIDYILFSDSEKNFLGWKRKSIPKNLNAFSNAQINRYIKMHPYEFFANDYDYSIYIDGNVQVISDLTFFCNSIKSNIGLQFHKHSLRNDVLDEAKVCIKFKKGNQSYIKDYVTFLKKEKFPKNYGLFECNVILSDLKNPISKKILDQWWDDFLKSKTGRDQLVLPYIFWKNHLNPEDAYGLGRNVFTDSKIRLYLHN